MGYGTKWVRIEMVTTVRLDEEQRDRLNELVEHYGEKWPGEVSQRVILNMLIDDRYYEVFGDDEN